MGLSIEWLKNVNWKKELRFFAQFNIMAVIALIAGQIIYSLIFGPLIDFIGFAPMESNAYATWISTVIVIAYGIRMLYVRIEHMLKSQNIEKREY